MIIGEIRDALPRVEITLLGNSGPVSVEVTVDTAFNGYLTLPPDILQQLGASPSIRVRNQLASGGEEYAVAAIVMLQWFDEVIPTEAIVYRNQPLLGMALLNGFHIDIEATEGGQVIIEPL